MTTLLGICAGKGLDAVVMASDTQATIDKEKKFFYHKINCFDNLGVVLGVSGVLNNFSKLLKKTKEGKIDFEKIVFESSFPELREFNLEQWGDQMPGKKFTRLLLATNFNGVNLYECFPLGKVKQMYWAVQGSGTPYVKTYLQSLNNVGLIEGRKDLLNAKNLSIEKAIELSEVSLNFAVQQDLFSSGHDLVVMTSKGIHNYGPIIKELESKHNKELMKKIMEEGKILEEIK